MSEPSPIIPRWFYATDIPKPENPTSKPQTSEPQSSQHIQTPNLQAKPFISSDQNLNTQKPSAWEPFSKTHSNAIELLYQRIQAFKISNHDIPHQIPFDTSVSVNEDYLYKVDILKMEISPIYWPGNSYDVRRGEWFYAIDNHKFVPCETNLSRQIEDGYRKFKPWVEGPLTPETIPTSLSSEASITQSSTVTSSINSATTSTSSEPRWALFGKYNNQSVIYSGATTAYIQYDNISTKLTAAMITPFTKGIIGTKLIRSWGEVEKIKKKLAAKTKGDEKKEEEVLKIEEEKKEDTDRQIDHLVFVIHGIGQKLGEKMGSINFVNDVNILRDTLKSSTVYFSTNKSPLSSTKPVIPEGSGIQVLPVHWRKKMEFGQARSELGVDFENDNVPRLEDITLEGVPSIRMIVSDVILDVLLYMTHSYRQQMVTHVTEEINRIYAEYKRRNPNFNGKVSFYGHSLGSVLAFDIVCNQFASQSAISTLERSQKSLYGIETRDEDKKFRDLSRRSSNVVSVFDDDDGVDLSEAAKKEENRESLGEEGVAGLMPQTAIVYDKLDFKVDKLFCVGSPIGLFMLLRGDSLRARIPNKTYTHPTEGILRPEVTSIYNIFHPHDPVAYRIEPLVSRDYSRNKPEELRHVFCKIGIQEGATELVNSGFSVLESMRVGVMGSAARVVSMVMPPASSSASQLPPRTTSKGWNDATLQTSNENIPWTDVQFDDRDMYLLNRKNGRLDYEVQENYLENPYIAALGVHMNYWSDLDCAVFIKRELFDR
ncbi:hypothetical protein HK096_009274 [Nowakowskiella sp. JEL0078]|nr:hypothetical protein HK096_009274 [Nowakowskiella sp. JEL0078]